jgi:phage tail-like protein
VTPRANGTNTRATALGRPVLASNFLVDLGNGQSRKDSGGFSEVIFPEFRLAPNTHRPGLEAERGVSEATGTGTTLILRRGATGALDLYTWWDQARNGKASSRKSLKVHLLSEDHQAVVLTWTFRQVRPVSLSYSPLCATESAVLIETLELTFSRVEMS